MMTAPLPIHTPELFAAAMTRAVDLLRAGEVVALPTETVYGLAANACNAEAVAKIYTLKGRPAHNPIIVHVADETLARQCVTHWPESAAQLARSFWPGPLTLVLPRSPLIPDLVTAGGPTVGIRWPNHPFMQAVIRACGFPLAAPSANLANALSPTTASHVQKQLGSVLPLIVDGGPAQVGIESTVLDLTTHPPRVLRPGMIPEESWQAVLASVTLRPPAASDQAVASTELRSPGLLRKHYAPRAKLRLLAWGDDGDLTRQLASAGPTASRIHLITRARTPRLTTNVVVSVLPSDPVAFAREIYAELHRCDEAGAQLIVVEALPDLPAWRPLQDRLNRAAAD